MKFDKSLSVPVVLLAMASLFFPFLADIKTPLVHGLLVKCIEDVQSLWLLFAALFTVSYMKPFTLEQGPKQFWLWSVVWWLTLFGRGISWGRDFFPEGPRGLFRAISIVLIALLVLYPLCSAALRRELASRLRSETLPLWGVALVVVSFLIADAVEHHRAIAPLFLHAANYQDLIEELYEIPFMVGLYGIALGIMRRDKYALEEGVTLTV
ncbi:hypothetical protein GWD52_10850 [Enterobacteriaceae bacterium 4M9]|nr:hypothetical protein [Enterobacteriaceae bacterium 4M9]